MRRIFLIIFVSAMFCVPTFAQLPSNNAHAIKTHCTNSAEDNISTLFNVGERAFEEGDLQTAMECTLSINQYLSYIYDQETQYFWECRCLILQSKIRYAIDKKDRRFYKNLKIVNKMRSHFNPQYQYVIEDDIRKAIYQISIIKIE